MRLKSRTISSFLNRQAPIFRSNSPNEGRQTQMDTTFLDNEEILRRKKMLSELQGIRRRTMTTTTTTTISSRRKGYEKTSRCGGVRLDEDVFPDELLWMIYPFKKDYILMGKTKKQEKRMNANWRFEDRGGGGGFSSGESRSIFLSGGSQISA
ncbi:hypothetical protein V1478_012722 [Vespula squamosa]|uniref:Uncharacterized protein n=1 Tax=Vespula squamosa TaxID=30214 RepID=A0ABD2A9P2_VESSQ